MKDLCFDPVSPAPSVSAPGGLDVQQLIFWDVQGELPMAELSWLCQLQPFQ